MKRFLAITLSLVLFSYNLIYAEPAMNHITMTAPFGVWKQYRPVEHDVNNNFVFPVNSRISFEMTTNNRISFKTSLNLADMNKYTYYFRVYLGSELIYSKTMIPELEDDFIWINWPGTVTFEFIAYDSFGNDDNNVNMILWNPDVYYSPYGAGNR